MQRKYILRELVLLKHGAEKFLVWAEQNGVNVWIKFQMEVLLDNINCMMDETYTLPCGKRHWPHFKEAYDDYKTDYYAIISSVSYA
jgi:hypothetical protein